MTATDMLARVRRMVRASPTVGVRAKVVAFTCGLLIVFLGTELFVDATWDSARARRATTTTLAELAEGLAATMAERIASGNGADLVPVARAIALSNEVDDVFVFDREGNIVARDVSGAHPNASVGEPAVMRAMVDRRAFATVDAGTVTAAAPIWTDQGTVAGYVVLRGTCPPSSGIVPVGLAAILLFVGGAAAMAFSASLVRPLKTLTAAARRMAAGDLAKPARVDSGDEFGALADGLNRMMARTAESMTAYEQLERELTARGERAEAASRAKSDFLANVGAELRTSLNAIIGFSDLLSGPRSRAMGDKTFAAYARDINRSGRHLLGLVTSIVEYAHIDAGPSAVDEVCDVELLMRSVAARLDALSQDGGVTVTIECTSRNPVVTCDRQRIETALANLLSVAIRATRSGGSVAVVIAEDRFGGVLIRIADSGAGMPPEQAGQVTTSAQAATRVYLAVALALARRVVEPRLGSVRVDSYPAIGNVVTISLPKVAGDSRADTKALVQVS